MCEVVLTDSCGKCVWLEDVVVVGWRIEDIDSRRSVGFNSRSVTLNKRSIHNGLCWNNEQRQSVTMDCIGDEGFVLEQWIVLEQ